MRSGDATSSERVVQVDANPILGMSAVRWDGAKTPSQPADECGALAEEYLALAVGTSVVAAVDQHLFAIGVRRWIHVRVRVHDDPTGVASLHLDLIVRDLPEELWPGVVASARCAPIVRALVHPVSVAILRAEEAHV